MQGSPVPTEEEELQTMDAYIATTKHSAQDTAILTSA
jgi:hypothetical protein